MSDYVAAVAGIYQAFGTGNIPAVLDALADDVQWEDFADSFGNRAGAPWLVKGTGKAHVANFFQIVGTWQITDFQVLALLSGGNKVAAEIQISVTQPSGASFNDQEMHLWTFNDEGKVSSFRHYVDTAKHITAAGLPLPALAATSA